jgi:hypothetical protein
MAKENITPIHEIKGKNGAKINIGSTDSGEIVIKSSEPTVVVTRNDIKEAARKLED